MAGSFAMLAECCRCRIMIHKRRDNVRDGRKINNLAESAAQMVGQRKVVPLKARSSCPWYLDKLLQKEPSTVIRSAEYRKCTNL
jgi:hypothetical protein